MHFTQAFKQSLPHLAAPTILLILILSAIDLALSSVYGTIVAHAPLEYAAKEDHVLRASTVSIVFYSGTVPLLSILAFLLALFLHLRSVLSIPFALIISTITAVGWITQASIWLNCEVSGPRIAESVPSYCPRYSLQDQGAELARGLTGWKIAFAWVVIVAEGFYIALCVYGIVARREAKQGLPLKIDSGSERELRSTSEA